MKSLKILMCLSLMSCTTSRITYEISDKPPVVSTSVSEGENAFAVPDREPDVVSVHPKVTYDYPERDNPGLYKVISTVNVREFPGMNGKVIGQLRPGETVVGNEVEGPWIRIYTNSYTSLKSLKRLNP